MVNVTRLGVYSISGADLVFTDADMLSGMYFVYLGNGQVAVFGAAAA